MTPSWLTLYQPAMESSSTTTDVPLGKRVRQAEVVEASARSFSAEAVTVPTPELSSAAKAVATMVQTRAPVTTAADNTLEADKFILSSLLCNSR